MASSSMVVELPGSRRFFKVMIDDFRAQLCIPPAFSRELKGEKTEEAVLTSYKGSWVVEVGTCRERFYFKEGWAEFADGHDLHEGEFLVFEHKGNMRFDVLVFDTSACEKRLRERSGRQGDYSDHHVKLLKQEADCEEDLISRPVAQGNRLRNHGKQLKAIDKGHAHTTAHVSSSTGRPYFTATIFPINCLRSHPYLNIPAQFWRSHDFIAKEDRIILRDTLKRRWPVNLKTCGPGPQISLARGWYEFFTCNMLKLGDVCIFELNTSSETPDIVLDVRTLPPPPPK